MDVDRRRFLKALGLLPVAPTVFSFGTGVWMPGDAWRGGLLDMFFRNIPLRPPGPMTATEMVMRREDRYHQLVLAMEGWSDVWESIRVDWLAGHDGEQQPAPENQGHPHHQDHRRPGG